MRIINFSYDIFITFVKHLIDIMSYIDNNLLADETVEYRADIHWFIFVKPFILLLLGFFFYFISEEPAVIYYVGLFLLACGVIMLLMRFLLKIGTEYVVTNKRVILKSGVLSRDALELLLSKCEGLRINQSILGRIFGFGTIVVTTGGVANVFHFISNPMKFRNETNKQISN